MNSFAVQRTSGASTAQANAPTTQGMSTDPSASKKVTPPKSKGVKAFNNNTYKNPHLIVDKSVVNELLLVCSVIGSTVDPASQKIVPVEDCINWLQDLQRALRRDEDAYRPISLLLGQWKVVEQKLIPLVLSCRYNTPLILTIVKILVILTKPLSESSIKAARVLINAKKSDADPNVIREQAALRENALEQAKLLVEYKRLFVTHPSHYSDRTGRQNQSNKKAPQGGLLSIFVSLLAEPLSRTGVQRSANDHLTIELILHLFRNLLSAGGEQFDGNDNAKIHVEAMLHQELICLFEKEMVLDFLLVVGQEMENRENKQYNLLLMEILHHMLKNEDPTLVARSVIASKKVDASARPNVVEGKGSGVVGSLKSMLNKEKQKLHSVSSSRHSHFGGTLARQKQGVETKYITANVNTSSTHGSIGSQLQKTSLASTKKRSKNRTYFVGGSGRSTAIHTRPGAARTASIQIGPAARKAQQVLHKFSIRFMEQCYGPVMKSLKNEFRRESSRLEGDDKVIFFRILWFFSQWWRTSCKEGSMTAINSSKVDGKSQVDPAKSSIGQLIFTMDVFTFNLVLNSTDFFNEHKQFKHLSQAVALYVEMIHLLYTMYKSDDSTEHLMAMGLMDRLFYQQDPIDRLPALLSKWDHGTFTRDYLCDLIELTHLTLKLLDTNAKACESFRDDNLKKRLRKDAQPKDAITRMKSYAADFEVTVYLARKIISSKTISMFTQLLSQYDINATNINDHIIGFFHRISRFVVASDNDDEFYGDNIDEKLSVKNVTLEPMLFNIQLMGVLNEILNDSDVRKDQSFTGVLSFASQFVRHFAKATEKNPMLFVEALFSHQFPHRHVERCSSVYVSEELKMLAARDMLIEQTGRELQEESDVEHEKAEIVKENKSVREDEDGEDEMEFVESVEAKIDQFPKKSDSSHAPSERSTDINNRSKGTLADNNADDSIERELDEDENRWNDRRSFVPKRKIVDSSTKSADMDTAEESVESITKDVSEQIDSPQKRARVNHLEDSDDEEELNVVPLKRSLPKGKARQLLEDSDEED